MDSPSNSIISTLSTKAGSIPKYDKINCQFVANLVTDLTQSGGVSVLLNGHMAEHTCTLEYCGQYHH